MDRLQRRRAIDRELPAPCRRGSRGGDRELHAGAASRLSHRRAAPRPVSRDIQLRRGHLRRQQSRQRRPPALRGGTAVDGAALFAGAHCAAARRLYTQTDVTRGRCAGLVFSPAWPIIDIVIDTNSSCSVCWFCVVVCRVWTEDVLFCVWLVGCCCGFV